MRPSPSSRIPAPASRPRHRGERRGRPADPPRPRSGSAPRPRRAPDRGRGGVPRTATRPGTRRSGRRGPARRGRPHRGDGEPRGPRPSQLLPRPQVPVPVRRVHRQDRPRRRCGTESKDPTRAGTTAVPAASPLPSASRRGGGTGRVDPSAARGSGRPDVAGNRIDPATVRLEGMPVARLLGLWLTVRGDFNRDGVADLLVLIDDVAGAIPPGTTTATLTGETSDGTRFAGSDTSSSYGDPPLVVRRDRFPAEGSGVRGPGPGRTPGPRTRAPGTAPQPAACHRRQLGIRVGSPPVGGSPGAGRHRRRLSRQLSGR